MDSGAAPECGMCSVGADRHGAIRLMHPEDNQKGRPKAPFFCHDE